MSGLFVHKISNYNLLSLQCGFGAKGPAKPRSRSRIKFGSQFNSSEVCMSHRSHVGKVMAGLILLLAVLFVAPRARTQAPHEDPPARAETGATPDPAQNQHPVSVSAESDQS